MRTALFSMLALVAVVGGIILFSGKDIPSQLAAVLTGNTVPTSAPERCVALTRALGLGSTDATTGGEVSKLQTFLTVDKTLYPEGKVTGYIGPATVRAIKKWQAAHSVLQTGGVGPQTRATFACKDVPPAAAPATTSSPQTLPAASNTIPPTCTLSTDKENYSFNDRVFVTWATSHVTSVRFFQDNAGDAQLPVLGTYGPQGSLTVTANISGTSRITMSAIGDGGSILCKKNIVVSR